MTTNNDEYEYAKSEMKRQEIVGRWLWQGDGESPEIAKCK
jgi:hypothetical protein